MTLEDFMITSYVVVEHYLSSVTEGKKLRRCGESPALSDAELITMEIVGEYLGFGSDKKIWSYFKTHWHDWFPGLGCRTSFTRQSANLIHVKHLIQESLSHELSESQDLFLFDGFPIPVCHIKRYQRSRSRLKSEGSVGYCAAKDEKYFGFKGHLLITQHGATRAFTMAAANIDEREALPEITQGVTGMVLADKGLISRPLKEALWQKDVDLQTPLRSNMQDDRPKPLVKAMMNIRRKVETVIGQLTDRFHIQSVKAKDLWHLCAKIGRKVLAHSFCFLMNQSMNPDRPLALELLLSTEPIYV